MTKMLASRFSQFCFLSASPLALVVAATPTAVQAQTRAFDIPAQPLSSAVLEFSRQADVMVVLPPELATGKRSAAVKGSLSVNAAIAQLLRRTGLRAMPNAVGGYRVAPFAESRGAGRAESYSVSSGDAEPETQEIIVTAQRRQERLVNVPISISVLRGEDLDRSTSQGAAESLRSVPGVATTVHHAGSGTQISIRGVAANGVLFRGSSPIAYYLDAAPFGMVKTAAAPDANVYDLERIEVLRGPQGTLYGASAQNGVVRIQTKDADLGKVEGKGRALLSNTEHGGLNYRADAALNVPLVEDRVALRVVGGYENLGGWIDKPNDRDANDAKVWNLRGKLKAKASDRLTVGLSAWISRADYGAGSASANGRTHFSTFAEPITTNYDVFSGKLSYDFDAFTLESVASLLRYRNNSVEDLLMEGFDGRIINAFKSRVFTEELTARSSGNGPWEWSLGATYRKARDRTRQDILAPNPFAGTFFHVGDESTSYAVFGELKRKFGATFDIAVGLRYFSDDAMQIEYLPSPGDSAAILRPKANFEKVSPRVVASWHPNSKNTIYASYAEGYRSGFNQYASILRNFPNFPPVKPDNLGNYEVGAKGSLLNGRLRYDAAAYYVSWKGVQLNGSLLINGLFVPGPLNGGKVSGPGVDLGLTFEPARGLTFNIGFGWNGLESDDVVRAGGGAVLFNKGDRLNYSPEYTASGGIDYQVPLSSSLEGIMSLSGSYTSRQTFRNVEGGTSVNYPGEGLFVLRAAVSAKSDAGWTVTAFVDNLTNENGAVVGGVFGEPDNAPHIRPRTMGLQLETKF